MNKISIDVFNKRSISDAISLLRKEQDRVEENYQKSVEELTQIGYEYMLSIVKFDTGELANSITWEYDVSTNIGRIIVGSDYAIFVEYGTGIVGANNPHPQPAPGWTYDKNSHGEAGWSYWDDKQQCFRWTKGQAATAFVYRTMEYMKSQAGDVLRVNMING